MPPPTHPPCPSAAGDTSPQARELRTSCHSNLASCFLQLADWQRCVEQCGTVLAGDANNRKALYRRGGRCGCCEGLGVGWEVARTQGGRGSRTRGGVQEVGGVQPAWPGLASQPTPCTPPHSPPAGQALCSLGCYAAAVEDLQQAVTLSPEGEKDLIRDKLAEAKQGLQHTEQGAAAEGAGRGRGWGQSVAGAARVGAGQGGGGRKWEQKGSHQQAACSATS